MSIALWPLLHDLTERAVTRFKLPRPKLVPALPRFRGVYDGFARRYPCQITLRVHRYMRPNQPLAPSTILATLAHELAHLGVNEKADHGPEWRALTAEIAEWMRGEGHVLSTNLYHGTFPNRFLPRHRKKKRRKKA